MAGKGSLPDEEAGIENHGGFVVVIGEEQVRTYSTKTEDYFGPSVEELARSDIPLSLDVVLRALGENDRLRQALLRGHAIRCLGGSAKEAATAVYESMIGQGTIEDNDI